MKRCNFILSRLMKRKSNTSWWARRKLIWPSVLLQKLLKCNSTGHHLSFWAYRNIKNLLFEDDNHEEADPAVSHIKPWLQSEERLHLPGLRDCADRSMESYCRCKELHNFGSFYGTDKKTARVHEGSWRHHQFSADASTESSASGPALNYISSARLR